jgi:hypothetical protein
MADIPARDHHIPLAEARALLAAHRRQAGPNAEHGGYFARDAIDRVLAQPGCAGLRFYHGRHADGRPALVVVGVTAAGADMTAGTVIDDHQPCPPYCDPTSALTTGE